jgi:hypothetical protein
VPDDRKHRGPHPEDQPLFAAACLPKLRAATADLSWLLTGGYAPKSAMKLVGDRHALDARQRLAVIRCACSDQALGARHQHQISVDDLAGCELHVDGYNVLTTIEAALSGGVILHARDGCYRDMASMHGTYRTVAETVPAIELLGQRLSGWHLAGCHWYLDEPVSNSGRLCGVLREIAARHGWNWEVELVPDPDRVLIAGGAAVATADSRILDHVAGWVNLARSAIDTDVPTAWIVRLSTN